jgi:hypothetical protein
MNSDSDANYSDYDSDGEPRTALGLLVTQRREHKRLTDYVLILEELQKQIMDEIEVNETKRRRIK